MTKDTAIGWTDHSFSPWWGCTEVSPGCDNCYARTLSKRYGWSVWGKYATRRTFGEGHWMGPLQWNAAAENAGARAKVFCASMADVFDADAPRGELERLWALIRLTPALDWQILTKRPNRIRGSLPADWGGMGYANVWLGTSVENQDYLWRVEELLKVPAPVHFVSYEPAIGPVTLDNGVSSYLTCNGQEDTSEGQGCLSFLETGRHFRGLDWVIVGGESGPGHRPFEEAWAVSVVEQCRAAGVAVFCKQTGSFRNEQPFTEYEWLNEVKEFPFPRVEA